VEFENITGPIELLLKVKIKVNLILPSKIYEVYMDKNTSITELSK